MPDPEVVPAAEEAQKLAEQLPDYAALYQTEKERATAADAQRAKLERDYASLKGSVRAQVTRDAEYAARMEALSKQVAALARGTGDEAVQQEVAQAQAQVAQVEQNVDFQSRWASISDELSASLMDEEGKPILDSATAPELDEVRALYSEAYYGYNAQGQVLPPAVRISRLEAAARRTQQVALQVERQKRKAPPPKAEDKPPVPKPPLPPMSTGPSAGAMQSDDEFMRAYGEGRSADHTRAKKILDKK